MLRFRLVAGCDTLRWLSVLSSLAPRYFTELGADDYLVCRNAGTAVRCAWDDDVIETAMGEL